MTRRRDEEMDLDNEEIPLDVGLEETMTPEGQNEVEYPTLREKLQIRYGWHLDPVEFESLVQFVLSREEAARREIAELRSVMEKNDEQYKKGLILARNEALDKVAKWVKDETDDEWMAAKIRSLKSQEVK